MKKLIIIVCGILFATSASASLWSYYTSRGEQLPPISERAIIAETCGISDYSGTYDQNIALEKCLVGEQQLGIAIPNVAALFETSLQNSVASDATTMTLVSATLKNGNTLSGLYGFIIDEGSANEEFVICTASSTALSACLRGIDPVDGKTEVSALKYSHRRGASIKITDYPILGIMRRVLNGDEGLPNFLYYDASTTLPTLDGQLATKYYVDTVGAGGFTSANVSTTRGLSVDGSSPERVGVNVSSTQGMAFDASGALYQKVSSTQGLQTDSNGIGINYAHNNTWTGTNTFNGTTTLATTSISNLTIDSIDNIYDIIAGSSLFSNSAARASTTSTTYVKLKETQVLKGGTYTVSFAYGAGIVGGGAPLIYTRIYKNGVAYGAENSTNTVATLGATWTEDLTFEANDFVQVYAKIDNASYFVDVGSFKLSGSLIPTSNLFIKTLE